METVLQSLGPAELLARAYAVELLINPRDKRHRSATRWAKLAALVGAGGASFFVFVILGSIGIGFTVSGAVVFAVGALEGGGIHLPGVEMNGITPSAAMVIAVAPLLAGVAALFMLRLYVRFLVRTLRRLLPERDMHRA